MRLRPVPALIATASLLAIAHGAAASQGAAAPARNGPILFSSDQVAGPANLHNAEAFAVRRDGSQTTNLTRTDGVDELAAMLSPDGSKLATLRLDGSQRVQLIVADADGVRAAWKTTIAGQAAVAPVLDWAPGSASLAIATRAATGRSTAYVVGLDGSRRVVVPARRNTITGLSWSPNGRRLAYALGGAGVYTVAADGTGTRRLEATGEGVGIAGPSWSPRGTWVAYVTETVTGATRLSLASGDGKKRRRLAGGVTSSRPAWSPTGATVAVPAPGGLLLAQPDGRTRKLEVPGMVRDLAWSPDRGAIAFARGPATNLDETVGVLDLRTGRVRTVARQRSADVVGRASWSPDGTRLVYLSKTLAADSELLAVQPDGTGVRVLTHNEVDDRQPAASPDGSTIAFTRGGPDGGIFLIDADGGNPRRVTRGGSDPSWSVDGAQLAFARVDSASPASTHVYIRSLAGNAERRLAGPGARIVYTHAADGAVVGYTSHPAWSPSGHEIAFAGTVSGTTDLFAVRTDGTGLRRVTPHVPSQDRFSPEWSSSGRLAYVSADFADTPSLWVQYGGRVWQDVTPSFATTPAWSPDGTLLVLGGVGPQRVAVTVASDGRQTAIPGLTGVVDPDWTPAP